MTRARLSRFTFAAAAFLGLRLALRVVFLLRRPDLVQGWPDALISSAGGSVQDAGFALVLAGVFSLSARIAPRTSALVAGLIAIVFSALSGAETEYFAYARSRFDAMFVAYLHEWRVLSGSVSSEMSRFAFGLNVAFGVAVAWLFWRRRERPAGSPAIAVSGLIAGAAVVVLTAAHPRRAESWFGAMAARNPLFDLLAAFRASHAGPKDPMDAHELDAVTKLARWSDPSSEKRFANDSRAPLVHEESAKPAQVARANVIFALMEGMEAAPMRREGPTEGLTPALDALADSALFYPRFFAVGAHTPRALDAVLCGLYPRLLGAPLSRAQPDIPLRCLPAILRDEGYQTAFVHGGMQSFENRLEFLGHIGFQETRFFEQFGANLPRSNGGWGGTDAQTYEQALGWIDARDQSRPFFLTVLSISNHHPFHVPDPALEIDHDPDRLSRNTVRYADREMGRFIEALRSRGLLKNTYVFILGDHGLTRQNLNGDSTTQIQTRLLTRANVPLIVLGPDGALPHAQVDRLASQVDLMPTVLEQLGLSTPNHALGQPLSRTWGANGKDLPVFVHDVYTELVATILPGSIEAYPLDEAGREHAEQTGLATHAAWRHTADGFVVDPAPRDAESEQRIRDIVSAVDALYRTETWWSPSLALWNGQPGK